MTSAETSAAPDVTVRAQARRRAFLVLLLVVTGLSLRLLAVAEIPVQPFSDFRSYMTTATKLARAGNLQGDPAMHPPGYPLVLSAGLRLAPGIDPLLAAKLVNCGLAVAAVLLGARLARRIAGEPAGVLAAAVLALHPRALLMPSLIASENLFVPLLFAFLLILPRRQEPTDAALRSATAGALIGYLTLTRSVAYFLGAVWLLAALAARRRPRRLLLDLALVLLVQHAVLLPWAMRNQRDVGRFTFLTVSGGIGMFTGTNENAYGGWYPWQADLERLRPGITSRPIAEIDKAAREEALRWARRHPGRALALYARRLWIIVAQDDLAPQWSVGPVFAPRGTDEHRRRRGPAWRWARRNAHWVHVSVRVAAAIIVAVGLVAAAWLAARTRHDPGSLPLTVGYLGTILYLFLVSAVVAVNGRYRWPIEDLLIPLGAAFVGSRWLGIRRAQENA